MRLGTPAPLPTAAPATHSGRNRPPARPAPPDAHSAPRRNWRTPHQRNWAAYTPRPHASRPAAG